MRLLKRHVLKPILLVMECLAGSHLECPNSYRSSAFVLEAYRASSPISFLAAMFQFFFPFQIYNQAGGSEPLEDAGPVHRAVLANFKEECRVNHS